MEGFGLLVGHLLGDYILQNDWMAKNKTGWGKDVRKLWQDISCVEQDGIKYPPGTSIYHNARADEYAKESAITQTGHLACTIHCLLYTLAVWLCSCSWMPWWGVLACFLTHWPIDRFRLAKWWMVNVSGQTEFATGILSPWSIIVVDNTFHLLTLFVIQLAFNI